MWSRWIQPIIFGFTILASITFLTVLFVQSSSRKKVEAEGGGKIILKQSIQTETSPSLETDFTILGAAAGETTEEDEKKLDQNPIVRVRRQGRVQGTVLKSRQGRDYFAFYQIPYAQPPVDELRFEAAESPKRWRGLRDGTKVGVACIQKDKYAPNNISMGDEACLHLNVYTPTLPNGRRDKPNLPVLVYIHGGGSYGNGTRYGAKYFMDEDVVLVTIEYRLGAFGSFTTGTRSYPGNHEYKDQVMALKWIQKQIDRFGGDPKRVLIFGNSSGSGAVHAHLVSPMSQGLFHRGIMQSGTIIGHGQIIVNPVESSKKLADELGCGENAQNFWNGTNENGEESGLVDCLRKVEAGTLALNPTNQDMSGLSIEPVPEDGDLSQVFLADSPWNIFFESQNDNAIFNKVPLMIGVNSQEMMHVPYLLPLLSTNGTQFLNDHWNDLLPPLVGLRDDKNHTMAQKFHQVYFGDQLISNDTRVSYIDLVSDSTVHESRMAGLLYANRTEAPVYFYRLSKPVPKSYGEAVKQIFPPPYGVAHADELQYLFLYDGYPEITIESEWFPFSQKMVNIWATFASSGNPSTPSINWPPIDLRDNGMKWMDLNDEVKLVEPFTQRMSLWDDYTEQLYRPNNY